MTDLANLPNTLDALVEHLRETDNSGEHDLWETADLVLAVIGDRLPLAAGHGRTWSPRAAPSFQSEAARLVAREITKTLATEGILVNGREANERTLLGWAENAHVWPALERVEGASFYAHYALKSPKYDGIRQARLERLRDRSRNGRVTETAVRNWIRDQKPAEKQTFLEKVERRIRLAIKAATAPWEATVEDDRHEIARLLRLIANEIDEGVFK
jgi:hypothetical protein